MTLSIEILRWISFAVLAASAVAQRPEPIAPEQRQEETVIFTAPGFERVGEPRWESRLGDKPTNRRSGQVQIAVRDAETGKVTPCRVNVVGYDGNFCHSWHCRAPGSALTNHGSSHGDRYPISSSSTCCDRDARRNPVGVARSRPPGGPCRSHGFRSAGGRDSAPYSRDAGRFGACAHSGSGPCGENPRRHSADAD